MERIEPRAADVLVKHVRLIASSPVRMRTKEDVERMVAQTVEHSNERVSALVVGVFADKKSKAFKAFALAAAGRAFNFAWVKGDDRAIVEQYCGGWVVPKAASCPKSRTHLRACAKSGPQAAHIPLGDSLSIFLFRRQGAYDRYDFRR